jgi:hypothetical protein
VLEPDLAFVVEDDGGVVGYVLGTADTPTFVRRFREEWLPTVAAAYPPPTGEPATPDEFMAFLLHNPERYDRARRSPTGRRTCTSTCSRRTKAADWGERSWRRSWTRCARRRAGAELSMLTVNTRARAYYDKLGFEVWTCPTRASSPTWVFACDGGGARRDGGPAVQP